MNGPDDIAIECWWETATTILDLDAPTLRELGLQEPQPPQTARDSELNAD